MAPSLLRGVALALAIVLATVPDPAQAKRRFVPREHRTLQAAIDAATPGDTIWVAAGVYRGPFDLQKRLLLFGDGGPDSTILDGGDSVRVLHVHDVRGGGIIGFGIRRGKATGGGGIQCVRDTSFEIRDCTLSRNWESAIGVWQSSEIAISGCLVRENLGSGIRFDASNGIVLACEFRDNRGHEGGGLALRASRMIVPLRENVFVGNRAEGSTGGAFHAADTSEAVVSHCTFRENSSAVAGGAIAAMSGAILNVSRSVFERNRAASAGAVHCDHSGLNVGYSIFDRNKATAAGAAIGVLGRRTANVNPAFSNNTFYKNDAEGEGATLFFIDVSPEVRQNILVVNRDQRAVTGVRTSPRYDCNLIWDPSGGAIGALPSANTLVGDPLFCDPEHGNFRLRDLSPAYRSTCGRIGAQVDQAGCATFRLQPAR